jgi:recombinational DNA repair protein RecT
MFGNKAQAMPMIAGILKKIRQSGEVAKVSAQVVYANDKFVVKYGFDEDVEHIPPALNEPRGDPIGAYATAVLKDGSQLLEVMSLEDIQAVRKVSRAANNGPWVTWFGEMARKSVMRRLSKRLPMSTDLEDEVFSRDPTMQPHPHHIEQTVEAEAPEPRPVSRLDAIEHSIEPEAEPPVEPEVITEQAEELEAEIEAEPATFSLGDQIADRPGETVDAETGEVTADNASAERVDGTPESEHDHPGTAIADALIAEINAIISVLDISTLMGEREKDIAAMLPEDGVRVEVAADKRKAEIREQQAKAKAKESADG